MASRFKLHLLVGAATTAVLLSGAPAFAATGKDAGAADTKATEASTANAASPQDQSQSAARDSSATTTPDIIVTAQKRSESVTKVPISIDVVDNTSLKNSGVQQLVDLPHAVPALRVNLAGTFVLPTIRGVGSMVALPGLTQNIATYVDGFYAPSPGANNFDLVNVESVNVLKGPQGTLFGANAVGGAIMINTFKPQEQFSGFMRAGVGSYGNYNGALYATGGLAKGITADIAASVEHGDGWFTNVTDGNDHIGRYTKWSVRPQLQIEPADGIKLLFAYAHDYSNDPYAQMTVAMNGYSAAPYLNLANGQTTSLSDTLVSFDSPYRVSQDPSRPSYSTYISDAWTFRGDFDLHFANLSALTSVRKDIIHQALDYTSSYPIPIGQYRRWTDQSRTVTQEVNLTSKSGGRLTWVVGGFFLDYQNNYKYDTDVDAAGDMANIFISHNESQTYSVYADATYEVLDHLFLTYGGRYSYDHFQRDYMFGPDFGATGLSSPWESFRNYSQRAVARYEITPHANVYVSYSQGYRSGGLSGSTFGTNVPVKPEHIDAYEVGFKMAQGPLRLNLAGFFYDYRDIQITSYSTIGAAVTVNAGRAHIYGLDGDLTYDVTRNLSFSLAGTLVDARYIDFGHYDSAGNCVDCAFETLYAATDPADIAAIGGYLQGPMPATGNAVERTPRLSGSFDINYGFGLLGGRMKLNADIYHTSSYWLDALHQLNDPAYTMLNLRATWTDPSGKFDVSVFGKNVNNAKYYVGISADPSSARVTYGAPALFGGQVTYHF